MAEQAPSLDQVTQGLNEALKGLEKTLSPPSELQKKLEGLVETWEKGLGRTYLHPQTRGEIRHMVNELKKVIGK